MQLYQEKAACDKMTFSSSGKGTCCLYSNTIVVSMKWSWEGVNFCTTLQKEEREFMTCQLFGKHFRNVG